MLYSFLWLRSGSGLTRRPFKPKIASSSLAGVTIKIISATKPRKILLLSVDPKNAFVKILLNTNGTNFGG